MSESIPMENVAKKFEKHEYGVIYLDILGQKELMRRLESKDAKPEDEEKMQKVLEHVKRISEELLMVKKGFSKENAKMIHSMHFARDKDIRQNDVQEALKEMMFGIQQFSDTTMIYVRLDGKNSIVAHQLFFILLGVLESSLFQALQDGIFIRGGVAKGKGWEIEENNLYGPVIEEVYTLEEKVAQWSRVVISNDVVALFRDVLSKCKQETLLSLPFLQLAKTSFVKGLDGVCQLSLFPECVLEDIASDNSDRGHILKTVEHFFHAVKVINDDLKFHREKLAANSNEIVERSKLILRAKVLKQEVLNGIIKFVDICRDVGSLTEEECKAIACQVQNEAHDDMGFNTPLTSIFED